jgi:hypothetical protein
MSARYEAKDILLDNGRVLVVGGGGVTNQTALAELYNPATGTWSVAGSLNKGRSNHAIARLADGRVMAVGGYGSNYSGALKSVEIYNPATDFWAQAAPTLYAHTGAHAFGLPNGKVVVLGGELSEASSSVETYDPTTNTWTAKASALVAPRNHAAAVQLPDGRILLAGGASSYSSAELYDPATGVSTPTGSLARGRSYFTLSRFGSGQVVAVGGMDVSGERVAEIEVYDIASGTWSTPALLRLARRGHTVTPLDGPTPRLLIAGGFHTFNSNTASSELYSDSAPDPLPPSVALTSPAAGSTLSKTTTVSASATDDRSVHRVEFYCDGVLLETDMTAPYSLSWNTTLVPNGSHTLTARAYDGFDNPSSSAPVTVSIDNDKTAPSVSITSPASGTTVSGSVGISVEATDNVGVTNVSFYVDNLYLGADSSAPYSIPWDTRQSTNGPHTLTVHADDAVGNRKSTSISLTSSNDLVAPTVRLTSPASGTITGTVLLTAEASDDVGVTQVSFFRDGVLIGDSVTPPHSLTWDTSSLPSGAYFLTAKAYDAAGRVGNSPGVTVYKDIPPDLIVNGGFEASSSPWVLLGASYYKSGTGTPASGTGYVQLGGSIGTSASTYQQVSLPSQGQLTLRFQLGISTTESPTSTIERDRLYIEVLNTMGAVLGQVGTFSNLNATGGYSLKSFSLQAYAGQTVRLRFRATNDTSNVTLFLVDDVSVR